MVGLVEIAYHVMAAHHGALPEGAGATGRDLSLLEPVWAGMLFVSLGELLTAIELLWILAGVLALLVWKARGGVTLGLPGHDVQEWRYFPKSGPVQLRADLPTDFGEWELVDAEPLGGDLAWRRGTFRAGDVVIQHHILKARRQRPFLLHEAHRDVAKRCFPADTLSAKAKEMYLPRVAGYPGSQFEVAGADGVAVYVFRQAGDFYVLRGPADRVQMLARTISAEIPERAVYETESWLW